MLEETLRDIGLSQYETKVYLALLELGESTTTNILKKIKIHIGRIYEILTTLQDKGLVSEVTRDGTKYFTALSAKKLLDYLQEKQTHIDAQKKLIESILPKFDAIASEQKSEPHIEIFTGVEGLKTAMSREIEFYSTGKEIVVFGVKQEALYDPEVLAFFRGHITAKRNDMHVPVRKINDTSSRKDEIKNEKTAQIRYLEMHSTMTINVFGNTTVIVVSYKPLVTIAITSEDVANGFRGQFESLWKLAKE